MAFTRVIGLTACATLLATTAVAASTAAAPPPVPAPARVRPPAPVRVPVSGLGGGPLAPAARSAAYPEPDEARRGLKIVTYLGRRFEVPYSWTVIDLTAYPSTCV